MSSAINLENAVTEQLPKLRTSLVFQLITAARNRGKTIIILELKICAPRILWENAQTFKLFNV